MLSVFLAHVFRWGIAYGKRTKCCPFFSRNFPEINAWTRVPAKGRRCPTQFSPPAMVAQGGSRPQYCCLCLQWLALRPKRRSSAPRSEK